jgi:hypothetical protein
MFQFGLRVVARIADRGLGQIVSVFHQKELAREDMVSRPGERLGAIGAEFVLESLAHSYLYRSRLNETQTQKALVGRGSGQLSLLLSAPL